MTYKKIVVVGAIAYDEIMNFPGVFADYIEPDKLHQLNVSFAVDKLEKQIGGTGTNIAYNIHLLAGKKSYLLGAVGKDHDDISKRLQSEGMIDKGIIVDNKLFTATGKVITDKKDNQIWGFYNGASASGAGIDPSKHFGKDDGMVLSAVHADAFYHFQTYAIKNNIDYMYDPGMVLSFVTADKLKEGVKHCKWLVANDYEMSRIFDITGFTADELIENGTAVITTLGSKGVHYADKNGIHEVPSYIVDNPKDPTGAGDAWRGGFMSGILQEKSTLDCLVQGNALASYAVENYGTMNHKPQQTEIDARMSSINALL